MMNSFFIMATEIMTEEFKRLKLARASALSLSSDPVYVLHFASQEHCSIDNGLFAVAVSEKNEIKLFDQETFCSCGTLEGHTSTITGLAFSPSHSHLIWSSSLDSTVRCWDTSKGKQGCIHQINGGSLELFTAMDISCDGKYLCAGTEQINEEDVFIFVWNITQFPAVTRRAKYEDLHSDDITQIKFHPLRPEIMASGSTDGLVSISNIEAESIDDVLLQTLNTESSVSNLGFFGSSYEFLYTITHIETVQFWDFMEGDQLGQLSNIRESENDSFMKIDYITDLFYDSKSERLFLVAGTFGGNIEIHHISLDSIEPFQSLHGCHSSTVRCILYNRKVKTLMAGGEDGMISMWTESAENKEKLIEVKSKHKLIKQKKAKNAPYKKDVKKGT